MKQGKQRLIKTNKKDISIIKAEIGNERKFDNFLIVFKKTTAISMNNTNSLFDVFDILMVIKLVEV